MKGKISFHCAQCGSKNNPGVRCKCGSDARDLGRVRHLFLVPPSCEGARPDRMESGREEETLKMLDQKFPDLPEAAKKGGGLMMTLFLFSCNAIMWVAAVTAVFTVGFFGWILWKAACNGL